MRENSWVYSCHQEGIRKSDLPRMRKTKHEIMSEKLIVSYSEKLEYRLLLLYKCHLVAIVLRGQYFG